MWSFSLQLCSLPYLWKTEFRYKVLRVETIVQKAVNKDYKQDQREIKYIAHAKAQRVKLCLTLTQTSTYAVCM